MATHRTVNPPTASNDGACPWPQLACDSSWRRRPSPLEFASGAALPGRGRRARLDWAAAAAGVLAALWAARAEAADYYVDQAHPSSADTNPGTEAEPWLTIQHGADQAEAGDTVYVKAGTYPERVRLTTSGDSNDPIALVAEPSRSVLMHGFTVGADYLRIGGFEITSSDEFTGWNEVQGVFLGGSHVQIVDNYIHDLSSTAIAGAWSDPLPVAARILNNTIDAIQMGITIQGEDWVVEGNEVSRLIMYGDGGDCDYMRFFGTGHSIRNNFLHGTDFDEIGDAHVDCFQTFTNNGEITHDISFDSNVCYDFHQGLMASNVEGTDTSDFLFTNNVFAHGGAWGLCVEDVPRVVVLNNTFYDIAYHGAGFRGVSTGNVVENNIFAQISSSYWAEEDSEVAGDYNLIFDANEPDAPGPNDLLDTDPRFVDPEHNDFRLEAESPAVDSGNAREEVDHDLTGLARPQGQGWDIGAYEYSDGSGGSAGAPATGGAGGLSGGSAGSPATGGASGQTGGSAGGPATSGASGNSGVGESGSSGAAGDTDDSEPAAADSESAAADGGCGCAVAGAQGPASAGGLGLAAALLLVLRRRRQ